MLLAVLVIPAIYIVLRGSAPGVWGAVCADALPPMAQNTAAALATINLIVTSLVFLTKASPGLQKNASVRISILSRGSALGGEVGSRKAVWAVHRAPPSRSES